MSVSLRAATSFFASSAAPAVTIPATVTSWTVSDVNALDAGMEVA